MPPDFLSGLSSRLYLWRQCAIADTRKYETEDGEGFHRAVSGQIGEGGASWVVSGQLGEKEMGSNYARCSNPNLKSNNSCSPIIAGLVVIEFMRAVNGRELPSHSVSAILRSAKYRVTISFPNFSHEHSVST